MDRKARKREYDREYYQTEKGKKHLRINGWKSQGIIADSWEEVYTWFIETETCDICDSVLTTGTRNTSSTKCLDHDHSITDGYNIRGVICCSCNRSETCAYRYIYRDRSGGYRFQKSINGRRFTKCFKTLEEAIAFRDAFISKDNSPV